MRGALRDRRDRASRFLLYGLLIILPLTAVFGHRGVAPWLLLASLPAFARGDFWMSAFGVLFDQRDYRNPFFLGLAAILFFCVWIFISGFWSPKGQFSLMLYVLAPLLVGGSVVWYAANLPPLWTYRLSAAFALSITAGVIVLFFEGVTDGFLRNVMPPDDPSPDRSKDIIALGRGVTALAPALFPAAAITAMARSKWMALLVVLAGFLASATNDIAANITALTVGTMAAALAYAAPRAAFAVLAGIILAALALTPLLALVPVDFVFERLAGAVPPSWLHRIAVWQSVAAHIPEGLPLGHGAEYARIWKESAPMIAVPGAGAPLSLMPTHPHNVFLQIWLELGAPGVAAFAAFVIFSARLLQRADWPRTAIVALAGAVGTITVSFLVEGSLWQVWRLAAVALAAMGVALSYSLYRLRAEKRRAHGR